MALCKWSITNELLPSRGGMLNRFLFDIKRNKASLCQWVVIDTFDLLKGAFHRFDNKSSGNDYILIMPWLRNMPAV